MTKKRYYADKEKGNKFWRVFYGEKSRPAMSRYASYKIFDTKKDALNFIKKKK